MQMIKRIGNKVAISTAALALLSTQAMAALPDEAKTAIESAKTDGMEAGWLVVGVFAALFVFAIVKRVMR